MVSTRNGRNSQPAKRRRTSNKRPKSEGFDPTASSGAIETNPARAKALAGSIATGKQRLKGLGLAERDTANRVRERTSLLHPQDRLGLERIIGTRDLLQITYLHEAIRASRAVCRIKIRAATPAPADFGTGFLVAPAVLLTNHHVLETADAARLSLAEFDAELDSNFVHRTTRTYNFLPDQLFVTDPALDFTFVAVTPLAHDGTPLSEFGWLPLIRESGKGLNGEWVSIIQHPQGETKQVVLRENRIVLLPEEIGEAIGPAFVHYTSDTERGSSGAPVLNDQFDVLALHHKAVPRYDADGNLVTRGGDVWSADMGEDEIDWIANEGVRISAIFRALDRLAFGSPHAASLLALLNDGTPRGPFSAVMSRRIPASPAVGEAAPFEATSFAGRKGFDPGFLGFPLPTLASITKKHGKKTAKLIDGSGDELRYMHFSVVVHAERRLPLIAAANIDGSLRVDPTASTAWRTDKRIPDDAIAGNELYRGDDNPLDRGHMVRRLDPVWGSDTAANLAVADTYHYTNAAPQEHSFNDGLWGDVEDYILQLATLKDRKISVFTGPVLAASDRSFGDGKPGGPWQVPARFWKVIAFAKQDGTRSATGFLLDQSDEIADLVEGFTPLPQAREVARIHQRTIAEIEKLTGLNFGSMKKFDPLAQLEATKRTRRIQLPEQIVV